MNIDKSIYKKPSFEFVVVLVLDDSMSFLKFQKVKKIFSPKENTQNVNSVGENLPEELLDGIKTGNVEKKFG